MFRTSIRGVTLILTMAVLSNSFADGHASFFPSLDSTVAYDSNQTQAEAKENIISDRFIRVDARFGFRYALAFNHSMILEAMAAHQSHEFTQGLDRNEFGGRFIYRWQNKFSYRAPWYQLMIDGQSWDVDVEQRDSDVVTIQAMASAKFTTKIAWVFGVEHKERDSDGIVFDTQQSRVFFHLDYQFRAGPALYGGYGYIDGDTLSTVQSTFCNGLVDTSVYSLLLDSEEVEWDQAFSEGYCGNWITYKLKAITQTGTIGLNYPLSHSLALDASLLYVDVSANGGHGYERQIIQFNILKAF